jgi:hypothetical protein
VSKLKLFVYGLLGLLALLRGVEVLFTGGFTGALFPLALGAALLGMLVRDWKRAKNPPDDF